LVSKTDDAGKFTFTVYPERVSSEATLAKLFRWCWKEIPRDWEKFHLTVIPLTVSTVYSQWAKIA